MSATFGFVGRQRERATLQAQLDQALAGERGIALIAGEPGIGKTRLVEELAAEAARRGALVLWGRCVEGEGAPAFWPWVQILRAYAGERDPAGLRAELGAGAGDIALLLPELQERLNLAIPASLGEPEQARFRLFDSLTRFLRRAAETQPLALILEDLHWADLPSLRLLQFLARELPTGRLWLLCTYRDAPLERGQPLAVALAELARAANSERMVLQGLPESNVARFIQGLAGTAPSAALVTIVARQTEGNPFFIIEVVRLLASTGQLDRFDRLSPQPSGLRTHLPLPQTVREVINRRLERLSADGQRALGVASVIGREFDLRLLGPLVDLPGERLLDLLDEAAAARVALAEPELPGRFRFAHALVRETLYGDLPPGRRLRLHRQVGELLERWYPSEPDRYLAELAYHFEQAAPLGVADRAVAYAQQAGDRARELLAYEEAARHYQRALQILAADTSPSATARRLALLLALGQAQWLAGESDLARATYQRVAEAARRAGDAPALARAALGLGDMFHEAGVVHTTLVALLEEALQRLDPADSALRARALARLAGALYWSGARQRCIALGEEAVAMARRVGDPAALAFTLDNLHTALWDPSQLARRLAIADEIVRLAEAAGDEDVAHRGRAVRLADLLEQGEIGRVDQEIGLFARLSEERQQPFYAFGALIWQAMRALLAGRLAECEQRAWQALAQGQRAQQAAAAQYVGGLLFFLRAEQGRLAEMEAAVQGFVARYPAMPAWRCALAWLHSELGREAEARREFERLAARQFADLPQDMLWLPALSLLAEVCVWLGDTARAPQLYDRLLPHADQTVVLGDAVVCRGSAARSLGLLASLLGYWETAAEHFERAIDQNARLGARGWLAHTEYDYATMLLARAEFGDQDRAVALLERAQARARELGLQRLLDKLAGLDRRLAGGARAPAQPEPAPTPAAPAALAVLSPRERQVAALLARGLSNRQIAEELMITPGTAKLHVMHILTKLGFESRAQIAAWAVQQGLPRSS